MTKSVYFKKPTYKGESIIDGLKSSIYGLRPRWPDNKTLLERVGSLEDIARANGLSYDNPFEAHIWMLDILKAGLLKRAKPE